MPATGRQEHRPAAVAPLYAGLVVLAACTACAAATPPGGTATLAPAVVAQTATSTAAARAAPTTVDPWAVPATITPAYLDRVLAALDHIDGNAFRDARAHDAITPRFVELEEAIRSGTHELALEEEMISSEVRLRRPNIRAVPGDRVMTVQTLLPAPPPCVLAAVAVDFSPRTVGPPQAYPQWYAALAPDVGTSINPTHWSLVDDGFETDGGAPSPARACAIE